MRQTNWNQEWIAKADICQDNGQRWVLEYYLQACNGQEGEDLFGLRVDKCYEDGQLAERCETPAVTDSRVQALSLINAFARGTVTPCTLLELTNDQLPTRIHTTWQNDAALSV